MSSSHEGVSCDSCKKNHFKGLRYKCLICYDYDLCSACHESGATSNRHLPTHPMQCIVAKGDYELFYSGETISSEEPHSLTCPLCGELGLTESTLLDHVTSEHVESDNDDSSAGVICPICGGETNQLTYDFVAHLTMEHRSPRESIEQVPNRGSRGSGRGNARTSGSSRGRRALVQSNTVGSGASGSSSSASARNSTDPLVEILAQLSGVRRACATGAPSQSPSMQLQQLQMHLQSSPPFSSSRTSNENREIRIMRRTFQSMSNQLSNSLQSSTGSGASVTNQAGLAYTNGTNYGSSNQPFVLLDQASLNASLSAGSNNLTGCGGPPFQQTNGLPLNNLTRPNSSSLSSSQYLLSSCLKPTLTEAEQQKREILKADRSLFVQELLLQVGSLEKNK